MTTTTDHAAAPETDDSPESCNLPLIVTPADAYLADHHLTPDEIAELVGSVPSVVEVNGRKVYIGIATPGRSHRINWCITATLRRLRRIPPYCLITGTIVITKQ